MYLCCRRSICELSVDQLVGFLVVEPTHPGLNSRFNTGARIFLDFSGFNDTILSVVGDVPVDSEMPVVTSRFFGGTRMERVCVHAFIGVCVHSCM
jgi:hypothetical protein